MPSSIDPFLLQNRLCRHFPSCGGCDFLDLDEENYRKLKLQNLNDAIFCNQQISQQEFLTLPISWVWLPLRSRRKIIFQTDNKNRLGFFAKKSSNLVEIDECIVAKKEISTLIPLLKKFLKNQEQNFITQIAITLFDNGLDLVFALKKEPNFLQIQKLTCFAKEQNLNLSYRLKNQLTPIFLARKSQIFYSDFKIDLDSEIFIQATKSGLETILKIIREELSLSQLVVDLYAGFGAYSFGIIDLTRKIFAIEGDKKMTDMINKNAAKNGFCDKIKTENRDLFSNPLKVKELEKFDLAIINPPRNGASSQIKEIAKSNLKKLIYVSCNPQSFWRDAIFLKESKNFKLKSLTAIDQFYGTKHLELVAVFAAEK